MCHEAEIDLMRRITDWEHKHDFMTDGEYIQAMNAVFSRSIGTWAKLQIRMERHGDTEKPGGEE